MFCDVENVFCLKFKFYIGRLIILKKWCNIWFWKDFFWNYFEIGYIFFCDNYYSFLYLFMDLWVWGIGVIGIVCFYRKGVLEKFKKIFLSNRGDIVNVYYGFLSCLKY